jgi:hypothetical protein
MAGFKKYKVIYESLLKTARKLNTLQRVKIL